MPWRVCPRVAYTPRTLQRSHCSRRARLGLHRCPAHCAAVVSIMSHFSVLFQGVFLVEARAVAMVPAGFFADALAKNLLAAVGVFCWAAREGRLHAFSILVWALWLRHLSGCWFAGSCTDHLWRSDVKIKGPKDNQLDQIDIYSKRTWPGQGTLQNGQIQQNTTTKLSNTDPS